MIWARILLFAYFYEEEDLKDFATKNDLRAVENKILSAIDGLAKNIRDMKDE